MQALFAPFNSPSSSQTVSEAMDGGIMDGESFEGLPEGDYYLIEEMLPILPKVCSCPDDA